MEITPPTLPQTNGGSSNTSAGDDAQAVLSSDFETFLQMLSVQLQNQDPLNPVDSADYAVQLATFSSVEQQVLTNNHLAELTSRIQLSGMSDLAGWVGMEARSTAPANFDGDPVSLALDIPAAADSAELVVRNDQGQEVLRESIAVGLKSYEWDGHANTGQAPNGSYSFEVESRGNGELLSIDPVQSYSRVIEARRTADNVELVLAGGGAVDAGDVTGLRQPS